MERVWNTFGYVVVVSPQTPLLWGIQGLCDRVAASNDYPDPGLVPVTGGIFFEGCPRPRITDGAPPSVDLVQNYTPINDS